MSEADPLERYDWAPGVCFRHPLRGEVSTAQIEVLHPRGEPDFPVRACRECVRDLEADRRRAGYPSSERRAPE